MTITLVRTANGTLVGHTVSDRWNISALYGDTTPPLATKAQVDSVRRRLAKMGFKLAILRGKPALHTHPTPAESESLGQYAEPYILAA